MTPQIVAEPERRARLARRHLLDGVSRVEQVADVADALVALHSSDPVTVYLSAAARLADASIEAIDDELYERRSVIRHHAMRRTLWVFTPTVARVAHASSTRALVPSMRRSFGKLLLENGVTDDPDRWLDDAIAATAHALVARGEATTRELGEAMPSLRAPLSFASGKTYGGTISAHTRVLTLMGFMGIVIRGRPLGSWVSGQYRWAVADDWVDGGLGDADPVDAAAQLVDRYLRSFGPASAVDVQWWTGWTKGTTTAALGRAGAIALDGGLFVAADDTAPTDRPSPWVRLLPGLDPTTMGWKERAWYLPDDAVTSLFDRNGNAGPTIWADGRVVGGWAQRPDGEIAHRLLEPISAEHRRLLDEEIERLRTFVGDSRFTLRFQTPLSRDLTVGQ